MKLTDGKRTIEIECKEWNGSGYDPDFSDEFLNTNNFELSADEETYLTEDVQNEIDYAIDEFTSKYELYCDCKKEAEETGKDLDEVLENNIPNDGWGAMDEDYCCFIYELKDGEWERIIYISEGEVEK